jgi:curved DNA-binding protein
MADRADFYDVLGLSRDATADEIQRAYRKLARTYHPDVNKDPGADDRFKDVSEAYDVLSDPETRARYDAFGHDFRRVPEGVSPDDVRAARAGRGGSETWYTTSGFDGDIDIERLFGGMFSRGGRGRGVGWGQVPGADQETEITLSIDEAFRGGKRSITLTGPSAQRTYDVNIPPGVADGQRIRLAGQGGRGRDGGADGDLYLVVRIAPDRRYRLEGRDLIVHLPLAPWEAALGTRVAVATPGGDAKVKVPPGSSTGRRLRLKGRGMPNRRGAAGDLYAEVEIMVPKQPSDEERRLFEELSRVSTFDPRSSL